MGIQRFSLPLALAVTLALLVAARLFLTRWRLRPALVIPNAGLMAVWATLAIMQIASGTE